MSGSFADVRAVIETAVANTYAGMSPPASVVFDNVQEIPPDLPYVVCIISYVTTTEPVICPGGAALERLLGNLQLSCYAPKAKGMKTLEAMAQEGMKTLNTLYDNSASTKVKCGQINGPTPVLTGADPYALTTLSCSFDASVG